MTVAVAVAVGLAAMFALPALATAEVDRGALSEATLVKKQVKGKNEADAGGYATCPRGMRVLTGGAYWHRPGKGPIVASDGEFLDLGASSPTPDGRRWYAAGEGNKGLRLQVFARCLPKRRLGAASVKTIELDPVDGGVAGLYLGCPGGERAITGGALWHAPNQAPDPSLAYRGLLASNSVTADDKAWYADGEDNYLTVDERFRITVICIPRKHLAEVKNVDRTFFSVPDDAMSGGRVDCPGKRRPLTGGGYWHSGDFLPEPNGNAGIFGGSNGRVGSSWFFSGLNFNAGDVGGPRTLTVDVACL